MNNFALLQIILPIMLAAVSAVIPHKALRIILLLLSIALLFIFRTLSLNWISKHEPLKTDIDYTPLSSFFGITLLMSTFFIILIFKNLKNETKKIK